MQTPLALVTILKGLELEFFAQRLVVLLLHVQCEVRAQVDFTIVVELEGCATRISESLLRRIPDVNLCVLVDDTVLVTSLCALCSVHLTVHRLLSPDDSFELSLQRVEQSIVRSDDSILGSELVVLRLHLQSDSVVLLVGCRSRVRVEQLRMCNLDTSGQDTVVVHECSSTIVLLLR